MFSATVRELQIVGEASGKLSLALRKASPEIAWQDIRDFSNILVHCYFGIDTETVWDVVRNELPLLETVVLRLIADIARIAP